MTEQRLTEIQAAIARGKPGDQFLPELEADLVADPFRLRALANQYIANGQWNRAIAASTLASALRPNDPQFKHELGVIYSATARYMAAQGFYDHALKLDPNYIPAIFARAQGHHLLCDISEALDGYNDVLHRVPDNLNVRGFRMVALNYTEAKQTRILAEAKEYGRLAGPAANNFNGAQKMGSQLRVGILSPDLRNHSVSSFLLPLLERCPKDISLHLFHDSTHRDVVTARLEQMGAFSYVQQMDNDGLEKFLLSKNLDVALDLAGHFSRDRLAVFARRVAPVQIAYLGYPNTTGVEAMDFRIAEMDSECDENHWTEHLLYMKSGMLAFSPPEETPPWTIGPEQPTLGYFGHLGKITPRCAQLWGTVMGEFPEARLIIRGDGLSDKAVCEKWQARWLRWGLDTYTDRVILQERTTTRGEHLEQYGEITVSLDTFPYNGTTTICESLWMGVPCVTLRGERHASLVAASLLRGAGLPHLVSETDDEYIATALGLLVSPFRIPRADLAKASWMQHDAVADEFWTIIRATHLKKVFGP